MQAPALLHVVKEAERPYDLRAEAWLSPALHHLPVALRLSAPPGAWRLSLRLAPGGDAAADPGGGTPGNDPAAAGSDTAATPLAREIAGPS